MNLKELGENLGLEEDEYRELIELFISTGSAEFQRLQTALSASDFDQMVRSSHTIKGAAANLGLLDVQNVAGNIEKTASANSLDGLTEAMQTLGKHFKSIETFVNG
jgi:HPt (histidine-containing phosphotransfer) domain-containing protein